MTSEDLDSSADTFDGEVLWVDSDRVFRRAWSPVDGQSLVLRPTSRTLRPEFLRRLTREFQIRDVLDGHWALQPRKIEPEFGALIYDDQMCRPLSAYVGSNLGLGDFLRVSVAAARAVDQMHISGLIHKDIRPGNLLVNDTLDRVWVTGFGVASRLPRERRSSMSPEVIEGTLEYMAPEQTGRMNRSVDLRSDLYAPGVSLYELFTGHLPFDAADPTAWIHSHVARQPIPPQERRPDSPEIVSSILLKLIEKSAEARYQTAKGLEQDLQKCLDNWSENHEIATFSLGRGDASTQLAIPEGLYGRQLEVDTLVEALNETASAPASHLILVSGYSGIGKTSVVNELQRALVPLGGLFAAGKFDQFKRDVPYAIFAQAFQGLVRQLLGKEAAELSCWRQKLVGALGSNGELLVNLIPELEVIIGKQPPVPALSGPEAHARLMSVFHDFIAVFASAEHPLVLFLDDLQWLDLATLDLFAHISSQRTIPHLFLIGAYRDNEVGPNHPLTRRLEMVRMAHGSVRELRLEGIGMSHVRALLADLLDTSPEAVADLSSLVTEKAGGNPFFMLQFIGAMADEQLIFYDVASCEWQWDLSRIAGKKVSENVVDLMIERLSRLTPRSLEALKIAACVGSSVDVEQFHHVLGRTERETQELLQDPLRMGLLLRVDDTYAFAHDRVQEAAYAMLSEKDRPLTHRRIAAQLIALHGADIEERVFDIVDQFNRAEVSEDDHQTRQLAASLNLRAGIRAKATSAYQAAQSYFGHGLAYLGAHAWTENYDLTFDLSVQNAECTFMVGELGRTGELVDELLDRAITKVHLATVYRLKVELHLVQSENFAAAQSGLAALNLFGIEFEEHPSQADVDHEFDELSRVMDGRPISDFALLVPMDDPEMLAAMRVLAEMWPPAFFTDFNLTTMIACRMVNISFRYGIAPSSNQGLAMFGWIMGPAFGRYEEGYEIVKLACELAQAQKSPVDMARVFNTMSLTSSWTQSLSTSIDWYRAAYRVGVDAGDVFFACFPCAFIAMTLLQRGRDLHQEAAELMELRQVTRNTGFRDGADMALVPERASACLRGLTVSLTDFSDNEFDQAAFERSLGGARAPTVAWFYWTRKVMLHYMAGEFRQAARAIDQVVTGTCKIVQIEHLDYHFYGALACAAAIDEVGPSGRVELRKRFDGFKAQLRDWVEQTGSSTFTGKYLLVSAEAARLDGLELDAQNLYEESIRHSVANEFLQDEAVANEAASRYYAARGFEKIARTYLNDARRSFLKWGADAKVALIDRQLLSHQERRTEQAAQADKSPVSLEQLDLATVIRVSQAVSSELDLDKLIDTIMQAAIEHAGAERAVLLLDTGLDDLQVMAEASIRGGKLALIQEQRDLTSTDLARSIVLYAARTSEPLVVDDASASRVFDTDPYVRDKRLRSVLCLPLTNQGSRIGLLYLENNLAPKVFTPNRLALLRLLASQAAVSLEQTRLYRDLAEREGRIRRLVDSNIIGIVIWDRDGRLLDANDSFLNMIQYTRKDLETGLGWYDMTPPDWQLEVESELLELTSTGAMQPREKEYFRRDGTRVRVLIGAAAFDPQANQGVAYILDLTERQQAERRAVESEQRFRELQSQLAHANRVETVGQLSTWIAHDVRQPLVGIVTSASAGFEWLASDPPNIEAARRSLQRVEEEGHRAAEILDKIRALMKKSVPVREVVDINELVRNTLPLLQSEVRHKAIKVRLDLVEGAPLVSADRVQLQQVVMNMVVNAIDAMASLTAREKELVITTEIDDRGSVITSVRDTGPLIPSEEYERFFEAFYSTKQEGLGIGLAICKNIVENYGGKIWGEPSTPHGTEVKFSLPRHAG